MKTKILKLRRIAPVFVFAAAVMISQFSGVQFAHATSATDTWVGGHGTGFNTAGNWSGNAVPANGDTLVFNSTSLTGNQILHNDITGLSVAGITFSGSNSSYGFAWIDGNPLTLTGNITNTEQMGGSPLTANIDMNIILGTDVTVTGPLSFGFEDAVQNTITTQGHALTIVNSGASSCSGLNQIIGNGALTVNAGSGSEFTLGAASGSYTGAVSGMSGNLVLADSGALSASSGIVISGTGNLILADSGSTTTWPTPLTLGGSGYLNAEHDFFGCQSGGSSPANDTANLTGAVTLTSDFRFNSFDDVNVTGTYTANGHVFTADNGITGTLTLPTGTVSAPAITNTYSDSQPSTAINVINNETATLDGARGSVTVAHGGTLEGSGTANSLDVDGTVAPGHSPGTLTVVTTASFESDSTYQAQLKDATAGDYDQLVVGTAADTTGHDVTINSGAKLDTQLYSGYKITKGDSFTIINNQSGTSVSGVFNDVNGNPLAEGAQFAVGNVTFSITYVGGDGNDVVLTALNTGNDPSAPNTAFAHLMMANPAIIVGLGIVTAGFFTVLAVRRRANR